MRSETAAGVGSRVRIGYTLDLDYEVFAPADFVFIEQPVSAPALSLGNGNGMLRTDSPPSA
jgi:hypothetical protein